MHPANPAAVSHSTAIVGGLALAASLACGAGPQPAPPQAPPAVVDDRPLASAGLGEPWASIGLPPPPPWDGGRVSLPVRGEPGRDLWVQYPEGPGVTRASARDAWRDAALANGWTVKNEATRADAVIASLTRTGGRLRIEVTSRWSWVTVDLRFKSERVVDAAWPQAAWCEEGTRPDPQDGAGDHVCFEVGTEMLEHGESAWWGAAGIGRHWNANGEVIAHATEEMYAMRPRRQMRGTFIAQGSPRRSPP